MATNNPIQLLVSLGVNSAQSRANIQASINAIQRDLNLQANLRVNPNGQAGLNQLSEGLRRVRSETGDIERANASFGDSFIKAFGKFSVWLGVSTVFFGVSRAIKDVTDRVIQLDTQLTALRRVLDIPDANFNTILERSIENVDALSGKVTDYLQLVGDFGRTGLTDTQAIDLANTATLLQNISDINADQAFDSLTAAMISFGIAAEDSLRIADSLNEVNNIGLLLW